MSRRNSKTKRKHRKDKPKQWQGVAPAIDFTLANFNPAEHELASDAQASLLVRLGCNEARALTMRKQDASREIDRLKNLMTYKVKSNPKRKRKRLFMSATEDQNKQH
jgi:hypothetical protein